MRARFAAVLKRLGKQDACLWFSYAVQLHVERVWPDLALALLAINDEVIA